MENKYKFTKIGQVLSSKDYKYDDGSPQLYVKIEKNVTLKEGQSLNLFQPNEKAPNFVVFDVAIKNQ
jgi:hypothetical protein